MAQIARGQKTGLGGTRQVGHQGEMVYDLKKLPRLPPLKGRPLERLADLVDHPRVGPVVKPRLLEAVGLKKLHARIPDAHAPTGPHLPPHDDWSAPEVAVELAALASEGASTTNGYAFSTVADYAAAYRDGRTTPADVAERFLEAISHAKDQHPPLNAFISLHADDVRAQAAASTARWEKGEPLSVLDGVPFPVKDEMNQRGHRTTVGTRFYGPHAAEEDATCVSHLRKEGALLVGKTNMHELGAGPTGRNPIYGTPPNPYRVTHYPGGSSSGSAVCVASGLAPVAVGADAGGSIRLPASFCGLVGLKPTFGRVSKHGVAPLAHSTGHIGPIGATARDCAVGYAVLAGRDAHDLATMRQPPLGLDGLFEHPIAHGDLKGVRLGVFRAWYADADADVVSACDRMLGFFEGQGAEIVDVVVPDLNLARVAHIITLAGEIAGTQASLWDAHRAHSSPDVRIGMSLAQAVTPADYVLAQRHRKELTGHFLSLFDRIDALVTPTAPCTAPRMRAESTARAPSDVGQTAEIIKFTTPANLHGTPAISFVAGYDDKGLPIGFQAMGKPWDEAFLLQLAHAAEAAVPREKPVRTYRVL